MKYAADFRRIARSALSGRWTIAVLTGFLASLVGAVGSGSPPFNFNFESRNTDAGMNLGEQLAFNTEPGLSEGLSALLISIGGFVLILGLAIAIVMLILGSVSSIGYSKFNLDLVDRQKEPEVGTLFAYFKHWKTAVVSSLLRFLYVFLWSLLFIIPGIVAAYSYYMTPYILAEHPELTASEAIEQSKQLMYGNRFRLFCLELSFIGWDLLCILSLGIGSLWLTPYKQAAVAAFYRDISNTAYITE